MNSQFTRLHQPLSRAALFRSVAVIFCAALLISITLIGRLERVSDDNLFAYGAPTSPVLPLYESLKVGGVTEISAHRLLCFPLIGYVPYAVGMTGAHIFQFAMHFLCALLVFALLIRLAWSPRHAVWATVFFLVAPWVSQSFFWWTAICVLTCTASTLTAAHCYLTYRTAAKRNFFWLIAAMVLIVFNLLIYEMWLAGLVLFFGLELYLQRVHNAQDKWLVAVKKSIFQIWPMILPYLVWGIWYKLTDSGSPHQPTGNIKQMLRVFLSVHLRAYQWITFVSWKTAIVDGLKLLASPQGIAAIVALAASIIFFIRGNKRDQRENAPAKIPAIGLTILFSWTMFLGSRLVFVLTGGVANHTRHNYGGGMAVAIGIVAILVWLGGKIASRPLRLALQSAGAAVILLLAVTTVGIGYHYSETARLEQATYDQLAPVAKDLPKGSVIIVLGNPSLTRGELSYYSEASGTWFRERIKVVNPDVTAFVVSAVKYEAGNYEFRGTYELVKADTTLTFPASVVSLYVWHDRKLVKVPAGEPIPTADKP